MAERRRRRAGKPTPRTDAQENGQAGSEKSEKKGESLISTVLWALVIAFVVKSFIIDTFWILQDPWNPPWMWGISLS